MTSEIRMIKLPGLYVPPISPFSGITGQFLLIWCHAERLKRLLKASKALFRIPIDDVKVFFS